MSIADELDRVADEATSDRGKQQDLVNLTFILRSAHLSEPFKAKETIKNEDGTESVTEIIKQSWIAVVDKMTGEEASEYWMDGFICGKQVAFLVDNRALPLRVKLTKDGGVKGNAYRLRAFPDELAAAQTAAQGGGMSDDDIPFADPVTPAPTPAVAPSAPAAPPEPVGAASPTPAAASGGLNAVLMAAQAKFGDVAIAKAIGASPNGLDQFIIYDTLGNLQVQAHAPTLAQAEIRQIVGSLE